jgi:hypothetical protein
MDLPPEAVYCHHTGFKKKCRALVTSGACNRWMQVRGMNPNTGEDINRSDCVDNWTPILLIENSQMQRQTGAAVESFRNEMVRGNDRTVAALLTSGKPRLISND